MTAENHPEYPLSVQPGLQPSASIYQAAQTARLGVPIAEYVYDKQIDASQRTGTSALVGGCLIFPALLFIVAVFVVFPLPWNVLAALALGALTGWLGYLPFRPNQKQVIHLLVCPGGLVLLRRSGAIEVIVWEQITSIQRFVTGATEDSGAQITRYQVHRTDGSPFEFRPLEFVKPSVPAEQFIQLGRLLEQEFVVRRLPQALAAYQAGVPVAFGPLNISLQGVSAGAETLPWSQVSSIEVDETSMKIKQAPANLIWSSFEASAIPNIALLQGVIHVVRRAQP